MKARLFTGASPFQSHMMKIVMYPYDHDDIWSKYMLTHTSTLVGGTEKPRNGVWVWEGVWAQ